MNKQKRVAYYPIGLDCLSRFDIANIRWGITVLQVFRRLHFLYPYLGILLVARL